MDGRNDGGSRVENLHQYKTEMTYKHLDFNSDKPVQYTQEINEYSELGKRMAEKHEDMTPEEMADAKKLTSLRVVLQAAAPGPNL